MSNNPPDRIVSLTEEQFQFMVKNCDANMRFAAGQIMEADAAGNEALADKLQEQGEMFRDLKQALMQAE